MALKGITVLELAGLAPSQYCGHILADFGARVIRIDKVGHSTPLEQLLGNGKQSVSINLKKQEGIEVFKKISSISDVLIEPYRTGVMERLGLGPEVLTGINERLIYARLSGYGQSGPTSKFAGHDINFLSLSGVLSLLGWRARDPSPPCNILGDFAAGSLLCAFGIVSALFDRTKSGKGQVVDNSITRGCSYLASWIYHTKDSLWSESRGKNLLDGGAYFYDTYETKDGKWMAVGAIEKKFYDNVLIGLELKEEDCPYLAPEGFDIFKRKFKEKTQNEWIQVFQHLDACVTPVLNVEESMSGRPGDFSTGPDSPMPVPEPRLSRSIAVPSSTCSPPITGEHTKNILLEAGYNNREIEELAKRDIVQILSKSQL